MPIDVTRTDERRGEQACRVEAIVRGDSGGVFRIAVPLMKAMVGASVRRDYRNLKALLESS